MTNNELFLSACYKVLKYRSTGNVKGFRIDKPFSFLLKNENQSNFELPEDINDIQSIIDLVKENTEVPLNQLDFNSKYEIDIESLIASHPGVNDASVMDMEENGIKFRTVYFSINQDYHPIKNNEKNYEENYVSTVKDIYEYTYSKESDEEDNTFNLIGWNNSYTGKPIPLEEMQEWVDQTVGRILGLAPKDVLEIGCGTGLLLYKIAPSCNSYLGVDLSEVVIDKLKDETKKKGLENIVTLQCSAADEIEAFSTKKFDTIIINSVIMYFPNAEYLIRVINKSINSLKDGGKLFIGDVRNYDTLYHFHASVNQSKINDYSNRSSRIQFIQKKVLNDKQLLLSPQFFRNLPNEKSRISGVKVIAKEGIYINEITKFRYDVIIEINCQSAKTSTNLQDWEGLEFCENVLKNDDNEVVFKNFIDERILNDIRIVSSLQSEILYSRIEENNNLIAVRELAKKYGYLVEFELQNGSSGNLNLLFTKGKTSLISNAFGPVTDIVNTNPSIEKDVWNRIEDMRNSLLEKVPFSQIPSRFICVGVNFKNSPIGTAALMGSKESVKIF